MLRYRIKNEFEDAFETDLRLKLGLDCISHYYKDYDGWYVIFVFDTKLDNSTIESIDEIVKAYD